MFALLCLVLNRLFGKADAKRQSATEPRHHRQPGKSGISNRAKPEWVSQHILRLKILLPQGTGVRKIAAVFNRSKAANRRGNIHVSKTYVANVLRSNQLALLNLRNDMRAHQPGSGPINRTWGVDLTGNQDTQGQMHFIVGIIDHGSRKLLSLLATKKHSAHLIDHLKCTIAQFGRPRHLRTDNESCFTSVEFAAYLKTIGIHHQRIALHCPWQNGRIERLFGTLKEQLNPISIQSAAHLQSLLDEFKHWYNGIRLHQHLSYQTPQEVWQRQKQPKTTHGTAGAKPTWWVGWNGQLSGVQYQC